MIESLRSRLTVARGYERIAAAYSAARVDDPLIQGWIDRLIADVPAGGRVLDLGCGAAVPYTLRLVGRYEVIGFDVVRAQLRLARANVPSGRFLQADMTALPFADGAFDAALSLYAVIHVPREEHPRVLAELRRVLRPGATVLLTLGQGDNPDDWGEYHGAPMYWSHFDAAGSRRSVVEAGFELDGDGTVPDPDGGAHLFVLARRPRA